ncbi:MAG: hypothetical protein K0U62_11590 [Actinomycetia bacterium]|nr:hypothetical protein [Actinomycetes bacterium]
MRKDNPLTPHLAKLKRAKRWPAQMQHLYDYFEEAEDPRARAEELLRCCSWEFLAGREYTGRLPADLEDVLDNLLDEHDSPQEALEEVFSDHPKLWDALLEFQNEFFVEHAQEESPSWRYLHPRYGDEAYDWLIHFSDSAYDIAAEGFCRGVPHVETLGLTTLLSSFYFDTEGYNFAYPAEMAQRFGFNRWGDPQYGKRAVLFRAPHMVFDHSTDNEPQAIFWGPSARDIIVIDFEYREPVLEADTLVLVADSGESVALWPEWDDLPDGESPEDVADDLQDEHGGEWTNRLEFVDVEEMLEWLEGPPISGRPRLSLFDPLSKPTCVVKHRRAARRG